MAKKGGVQQLQAEINTSDELIKFLERDGLIGSHLHSFDEPLSIRFPFCSDGRLYGMVWAVRRHGWQPEEN